MRRILYLVPLVAATVSLPWVVPVSPLRHLDDPGYLGVLGFGLTLGVLALGAVLKTPAADRLVWWCLLAFLVGMPLVYVADWLRFGGSYPWLAVELAGLALFGALALLAVRRSPWFLAAGILGHALWDAAHYGRTAFVPDWYALGCFLIDVGLGLYVLSLVPGWLESRRQPEKRPAST